MNQEIKSVEQQIFEKVFPNEEFDADNFEDWAAENPRQAYLACIEIANSITRLNQFEF